MVKLVDPEIRDRHARVSCGVQGSVGESPCGFKSHLGTVGLQKP